jgi:hypothetical protein
MKSYTSWLNPIKKYAIVLLSDRKNNQVPIDQKRGEVNEESVFRYHLSLAILTIGLLVSLLIGCNSIPASPTPTSDLTIVWSDDFEDGDTEGWEEINQVGFISVEEDVLTFRPELGGTIEHQSSVSTGTWSFDVFMTEDLGSGFQFILSICNGHKFGFGIQINNLPKTVISIITVEKGENSAVED